ncbi:MAG: hypothetical protein KAH97_02840 [Anaerolineales bacterium]|nr:hypothetical protein [Anaerolineales bacterium]
MNEIANQYAEQGVGSIFLYTHEPHPGENYSHLTSMEQKFNHARDLRDKLGVNRSILVDSLDGACHREYGSMPNMTWIFSRSGIPVYKSDWTDAASVANAVDYFVGVRQRRRDGERLAPFQVQRLDFHNQDWDAFYEGLARNGPKAVREVDEAFE